MAKSKQRSGKGSKRTSRGAGAAPQNRADDVVAPPSRGTQLFLRGSPVVLLVVGGGVYLATKSTQAVAVIAALGVIVWLAVALSVVGAQVPPRERTRAGSIDFGRRDGN